MRIFKTAEFYGEYSYLEKLAEFINDNGVKQQDIVNITFHNNSLFLFYYVEE